MNSKTWAIKIYPGGRREKKLVDEDGIQTLDDAKERLARGYAVYVGEADAARIRPNKRQPKTFKAKRCPFCERQMRVFTRETGDEHYVVCGNCGAMGPNAGNEAQALELWNIRPIENQLQEQLDEANERARESEYKIYRYL